MAKTIYILTALALIATLGGLFYLDRELNTLAESKAELATLQSEHQQLAALEKLLAETAAGRAKVNAQFVDQDQLPQFIEQLERAGALAGVKFNLGNAAVETKGPPVAKFTLATEGSFANTWQFLRLLENLPFIIDFRQVQLDAAGEGRWRGSFSLNLVSFNDRGNGK